MTPMILKGKHWFMFWDKHINFQTFAYKVFFIGRLCNIFSLKRRKLEAESELEIAQVAYEETRIESFNIKQQNEDIDKTILLLKDQLEVEKRDAVKRGQLLSMLGPKSEENQAKVNFKSEMALGHNSQYQKRA